MVSPLHILQQYWRHTSFRPMQEEIINAVLSGKDVLALLPTGGGKSICFQVPALMQDGVCLVISPLIALMKDQVANLLQKGIPAMAIHSGMPYPEVQQCLQQVAEGEIKFLYLSPERLETELFKDFLEYLQINLIAVDEAHCISQWGYDFRPPYLRIAQIRTLLPNVPVLALTASATPKVQEDIIDKLLFKQYSIFKQSFERPTLSYSVFLVDSKINKLLDILRKVPGSSIVYCKSRRLTKEVAQMLAMQQVSVNYYHAGLSEQERSERQMAWLQNKTRVMVCTNAFGMGIDKPGVRTVVHYDAPDCIENYYQEAGRAGRDGQKAFAVLLYTQEDIAYLQGLPQQRFPDLLVIQQLYQALADYLQIPVGIGQYQYFDFDFGSFVKTFKLDLLQVINVLKVLEQEGHLSFNENIFLPAKVMFKAPQSLLEAYEESHPMLQPVIKCLLRTYQGILDNRVSVNEKQIAKMAGLSFESVYKDLQQLHALGIIEYLPQKETPQIHFLTNRAPASFLHIDKKHYASRKKLYTQRVKAMLQFMGREKDCRSVYIAAYFGDNAVKKCGICDNCLHQKSTSVAPDEFSAIQEKLYAILPPQGMDTAKLLLELTTIPKAKLWQVLNFLQAEHQLAINEFGWITKL
jgi:ATP-dependent DNA helicase RecQ